MRTTSFGSSSRRSSYHRNSDYVDGDLESVDYGSVGGAMLPVFLADLRRNERADFVEVTLEIDHDSILISSITPTAGEEPAGNENVGGFFSRSLSTTSRIRRKFPWLRSASSRSEASAMEESKVSARNARKMQARLDRTRSGAQQALKGLRFISKTTGNSDTNEQWKKVESRFDSLAKDGLLSRDDFAECIGRFSKSSLSFRIFYCLQGWDFDSRLFEFSVRDGGFQGICGGDFRRAGETKASEY